jgi:hypothetical protein
MYKLGLQNEQHSKFLLQICFSKEQVEKIIKRNSLLRFNDFFVGTRQTTRERHSTLFSNSEVESHVAQKRRVGRSAWSTIKEVLEKFCSNILCPNMFCPNMLS